MILRILPKTKRRGAPKYPHQVRKDPFWALVLGSIGVVYGDIGTSPLYAFREAARVVAIDGVITTFDILGILSLILWALIVVVTLKYVVILLRADNHGEGGILSLMALARDKLGHKQLYLYLGLIGAALFYGDAAITPAISVLSAVEGLDLATPAFSLAVLPLTIVILCLLFYAQRTGTAKISLLFGPVTTVWFLVIGFLGVVQIAHHPYVLTAFNPLHAIEFMAAHVHLSMLVLGAVFLAVTGAEALYADLGHFGKKPIQTAWIGLVFPCLAMNYLGQGALLLSTPSAIDNPFYRMAPDWALLPLVVLATLATIVASQAVISGAYSITQQAIQLGLLPRMDIRHTSADLAGQIYLPRVNTLLLLVVVLLCLLFKNSSALAAAYGISVVGTMIVTTILAFFVVWRVWRKKPLQAAAMFLPFFFIDLVFLKANLHKILDGGYVPLAMAAALVTLMAIWVRGSRYIYKRSTWRPMEIKQLLGTLGKDEPVIVRGTAVYLTNDANYSPMAMLQNVKHNKVWHERNILLSITTAPFPLVSNDRRVVIKTVNDTVTRVFVTYGFMEIPDVPRALALAKTKGLKINLDKVSYFLGRRTIVSDSRIGLPDWQSNIFIFLTRSASDATDFYRLPPDRVIEIGTRVNI